MLVCLWCDYLRILIFISRFFFSLSCAQLTVLFHIMGECSCRFLELKAQDVIITRRENALLISGLNSYVMLNSLALYAHLVDDGSVKRGVRD